MQLNTKILCFFASETSTPQKYFISIRQQLHELSAKFVKLPYPTVVKIQFKNACILIMIWISIKI